CSAVSALFPYPTLFRSPSFGTPREYPSPVQEGLGLLALGIPAPGTMCRLLDDEGNDVPIGTPGELTIKGPQVMVGYWNKPEETQDRKSKRLNSSHVKSS